MFPSDGYTQHFTPPTYWDRCTEQLLPSTKEMHSLPPHPQKKPHTRASFPTERELSADRARWSFFFLPCPPGPFSTFAWFLRGPLPTACSPKLRWRDRRKTSQSRAGLLPSLPQAPHSFPLLDCLSKLSWTQHEKSGVSRAVTGNS